MSKCSSAVQVFQRVLNLRPLWFSIELVSFMGCPSMDRPTQDKCLSSRNLAANTPNGNLTASTTLLVLPTEPTLYLDLSETLLQNCIATRNTAELGLRVRAGAVQCLRSRLRERARATRFVAFR